MLGSASRAPRSTDSRQRPHARRAEFRPLSGRQPISRRADLLPSGRRDAGEPAQRSGITAEHGRQSRGPRGDVRDARVGRRDGRVPRPQDRAGTAGGTRATASDGWTGMAGARGGARQHREAPSTYLRKFYYDCIVYTESALRFLNRHRGRRPPWFRPTGRTTWRSTGPSPGSSAGIAEPEEKDAILWKNIERLLNL